MNEPKIPKELDAIVDAVLAYKPKPKTNPAKKRRKMSTKLAKNAQTREMSEQKNSNFDIPK